MLVACGAFFVFGYSVRCDRVVVALDECVSAFWAVGVFVFVSLHVADVRVIDARFLSHVVGFFKCFDFGGWFCELVRWSVPCEV